MSGLLAHAPRSRQLQGARVLLGIALLVSMPVNPATAHPIRHHPQHHLTALQAHRVNGLSAYLAGSPNLWSRSPAPKFPASLHATFRHGLQSDTAFANYLLYRRSLDPVRFDFYHPRLAPVLQHLTAPQVSQTPTTPSNPSTPTLTAPQPERITVPEPATLTIALALIASAAWWRRQARLTI